MKNGQLNNPLLLSLAFFPFSLSWVSQTPVPPCPLALPREEGDQIQLINNLCCCQTASSQIGPLLVPSPRHVASVMTTWTDEDGRKRQRLTPMLVVSSIPPPTDCALPTVRHVCTEIGANMCPKIACLFLQSSSTDTVHHAAAAAGRSRRTTATVMVSSVIMAGCVSVVGRCTPVPAGLGQTGMLLLVLLLSISEAWSVGMYLLSAIGR